MKRIEPELRNEFNIVRIALRSNKPVSVTRGRTNGYTEGDFEKGFRINPVVPSL